MLSWREMTLALIKYCELLILPAFKEAVSVDPLTKRQTPFAADANFQRLKSLCQVLVHWKQKTQNSLLFRGEVSSVNILTSSRAYMVVFATSTCGILERRNESARIYFQSGGCLTSKMINGTLVIDMGMLSKQNRVIWVWGSKFATVMHFGLKEDCG